VSARARARVPLNPNEVAGEGEAAVDALRSECPPQRRCEATVTSNGSDLWGTIIRRTSESTQRVIRGHSEGTQRALRGHSEGNQPRTCDLWSSPFSRFGVMTASVGSGPHT
jgi:hypothetical protein